MIFQFVAFAWLARILGVNEFGSLAAILAILALVTPFVELGSYNLIVNDVARGILPARTIGNSLLLMAFTVPLSFVILIPVKLIFVPDIPFIFIFGVAVSELIGGRFWTIANAIHIAQAQLWRNAFMEGLNGLSRLIFVYLLASLSGSLSMWISFLIIHNLVIGTAALFWVIRAWGSPTASWSEFLNRLKPGIYFALGAVAQNTYTDLDKAMLSRLSNFEAVGIYTAAHRIALISYLPLSALLSTTYPKFFEIGQVSFIATRTFGFKVLRLATIYGLIASTALWFAAPLLPNYLGEEYSESVRALQWLAIIPLIQSLYFPLGDILTGTGNQVWRSAVQIASLLVNVILNYLWIPTHGWLGSVWATIASQGILVILILLLVFLISHQNARKDI